MVYTLTGPGADIVASVNRRGRIWTYTRSSTATELTVVVTDPQSRQSTYVFDLTTGSIKSPTNTAGEVTTYQNDTKGRPSIVTLPTGETVRYSTTREATSRKFAAPPSLRLAGSRFDGGLRFDVHDRYG